MPRVKILKHLPWIIPLLLVLAVGALMASTALDRRTDRRYHAGLRKALEVHSNSFEHEGEMPVEFSCKGRGMAPHIQWTSAPDGTKSFALIATDWDAPAPWLRLFSVAHWVLFNIPASTTQIPRDSSSDDLIRVGINSGNNMSRRPGYIAPCPPFGTHRYEFRVYALDVDQIHPSSNDKSGIMQAMNGHVIAYGELIGLRRP